MESLCPKRMSRQAPLPLGPKMAVIAVAASFGHVLGVLLALAGLEWYLVRAARDAREARAARREAARLRAEIRRHDSVEHFVRKSKLERELIAAEKALETHRSATAARVGIARRQGGQARVGACVCLALWCTAPARARAARVGGVAARLVPRVPVAAARGVGVCRCSSSSTARVAVRISLGDQPRADCRTTTARAGGAPGAPSAALGQRADVRRAAARRLGGVMR